MSDPVYTDTNDTSPANTPDFQHFMETLEAFEKLDHEIKRKNLNSFNPQDLKERVLSNSNRYAEIINQLTLVEKLTAWRFDALMQAWRVNYQILKGDRK